MAFLMQSLQAFTGAKSEEHVPAAAMVHANIVLYAFAYWLTQPVLPFLTKELGVDAQMFGYLQTVFSFVQLLGGPLVGRLCDSQGARSAMQISQTMSGLSYVMLGLASSVAMLFVSRLPTVFMQTMHASQAFITDMTPADGRSASLGRLSLSYGVGMVLGSFLGGHLSGVIGLSGVALCAGAVSILAVVPNMLLLPAGRVKSATGTQGTKVAKSPLEPTGPGARPAGSAGTGSSAPVPANSGLNLSKTWTVLSDPAHGPLRIYLGFQLVLGLGATVYNSMYAYIVSEKFGVQPSDLGTLQSLGAVVGVVVNTVAVGPISRTMRETSALQICSAMFAACFFAFSFVSTKTHLYLLLLPLSFASAVFYTVSTSVITKLVSSEDTGTAIGFSHATRSACGIVAPTIGGLLVNQFGYTSVGSFAGALCVLALLFLQFPSINAATTESLHED